VIAEWQYLIANDLAGLVALAGNQQRIARLQRSNRGANGLGAVADLPGIFRRRQNGGANGCRIFAARIVVGDDDAVGICVAISPIKGRLPASRSPPAPNTTTSLRLA